MTNIIELRGGGIVTHTNINDPEKHRFVGDIEKIDDFEDFQRRVDELS